MIKDTIEIIIKYSKSPKLYIILLSVLTVVFLLWPFIYANFFYYSRMHNRVEILSMLNEIDLERLALSYILYEEYQSILAEIELQRTRIIGIGNFNLPTDIVVKNEAHDGLWKFISGGILTWLVCLMIPFMNTFTKKGDKPIAFFALLSLGGLLGLIGMNVPTILGLWYNLIGFPLLQILAIVFIALLYGWRKKPFAKSETSDLASTHTDSEDA